MVYDFHFYFIAMKFFAAFACLLISFPCRLSKIMAVRWEYELRPLVSKEKHVDGLLAPLGKASTLKKSYKRPLFKLIFCF